MPSPMRTALPPQLPRRWEKPWSLATPYSGGSRARSYLRDSRPVDRETMAMGQLTAADRAAPPPRPPVPLCGAHRSRFLIRSQAKLRGACCSAFFAPTSRCSSTRHCPTSQGPPVGPFSVVAGHPGAPQGGGAVHLRRAHPAPGFRRGPLGSTVLPLHERGLLLG